MKTVIICKSIHHNNTLKIAQAMADELEADIFTPEKVNDNSLQDYDLIGFGSGIYGGRHHRSILNVIEGLDSLSGKDVFVFYTSGFERFPVVSSFECALVSRLEGKGTNIKGKFSCRGFDTWGPFRVGGGKNKNHPDETDTANARAFAKSLAQ
ncbi:MAG: flavodoxin family protein [Candidatus Thorarchaeota archaeon]|nr:flavodoxin family protein [Candidatus Thorarchaeota archaeon]